MRNEMGYTAVSATKASVDKDLFSVPALVFDLAHLPPRKGLFFF